MKFNTKVTCDFCGTPTLDHSYTPINSARGMEVFLCSSCGLAQSFPTKPYESRPPGSMSSDADRSSYRYTKDVISGRYDECLAQFVDFSTVHDVLDVGSNRGAFIQYLEDFHPGKHIVAVEPDSTVTKGYASMPNVTLHNCRFEHIELPESHFDFSYCAHTLEHADSAREMLLGIRSALKPGGKLLLAVPSLIFYSDIIEEIFIDPHTYHFDYYLLKDFVSQVGFEIVYSGRPDDAEVLLLLKKVGNNKTNACFSPSNKSLAGLAKTAVRDYQTNIHRNRDLVRQSVLRLHESAVHFHVVIWGGGRIFDALVRFGGLDLSKIDLVVDKYLYRYESALHGRPLESPDAIKDMNISKTLVYIASRDYADEIYSEASAMGINHFIIFGKIPN